MKNTLSRSMPALIALKCKTASEPITTAVLGMGLIESGGEIDDARIAQAYRDVATDHEPAVIVRDFYLEQVEQHPWLEEPIAPFLSLLAEPDDHHEAVRTVAAFMGTQSFYGCEEMSKADLIGRVITDMKHQAARRQGVPGYAITMDEAMHSVQREMIDQRRVGDAILLTLDDSYLRRVHAAGHWADLWCDSGMRLIGLAAAMRKAGLDPETMTWVGMDGDAMKRAIAAVNMVGFAMGEKVQILDGSTYKEALLAAGTTLYGQPITDFGMPEDVARTTKGAYVPEDIKEKLEAAGMPRTLLPWGK